MAQQVTTVELVRDGQCTPWGFRLTGGVDVGSPLVIQRVFLGSPSEGELKRGDMITRIRDVDASKLTHKQASDLITKAGNNMKLVVLRVPGFVPASPPASPIPALINPGTPVTIYHLTSSTASSSTFPMYTSPPGSEHLFKPLPTTQFPETPAARHAAMAYQQENEANKEKAAIINQPYRSVPLILPGVKSTKDTPTGSYLRFTSDTSGWKSQPGSASQRVNEAYMLSKVQEAVQEAASLSPRASVCPGRTPTPDSSLYGSANGPQVYLRQYNSPINMYSNQAIRETIVAQTGAVTKEQPTLREALKDVIVDAAIVLSDDAGRTVSPRPPSDISKSPTYQLIHEEEWKNLDKKNLREMPPVQERVHNVIPPDDIFGMQQKIHQSGSFRTLMTSMQGLTEF